MPSNRTRRRVRGKGGSRVRVERGRGGRRLIVDETFASFYRPGSATTGSVWDAIAAPLLALPASARRSVLLLGLGGGSAARIVRALAPEARIVGVELDREVVEAARRWFDLDDLDLELVVGDALDFLQREESRFDVILEDVFIGRGDRVRKPDWIPLPGHALAAARLRPAGLLVSNTLDESSRVANGLRTLFPSLVSIEVADYDNVVFAAGPQTLNARALRAAVARDALLAGTLPALRFRSLTSARPRETAARSD